MELAISLLIVFCALLASHTVSMVQISHSVVIVILFVLYWRNRFVCRFQSSFAELLFTQSRYIRQVIRLSSASLPTVGISDPKSIDRTLLHRVACYAPCRAPLPTFPANAFKVRGAEARFYAHPAVFTTAARLRKPSAARVSQLRNAARRTATARIAKSNSNMETAQNTTLANEGPDQSRASAS